MKGLYFGGSTGLKMFMQNHCREGYVIKTINFVPFQVLTMGVEVMYQKVTLKSRS
jgi:hypothetical protein